MAESFGARMRRRREAQGIALTAVADRTKIKASLLEAMERNDVKYWPNGIFRRAFIRAYANAIGLDPDVVVQEFLECFPDSAEVEAATPVAAMAPQEAAHRGAPENRLRALVGTAIGSISLRRRPDPQRVEAAAPRPAPRAAAATAPAPETLPMPPPPSRDPDLLALAQLCTEFARVDNVSALKRLLKDAASILDARGVIVWLWDAPNAELRPALTYGYSDRVLARIRAVDRDADNATATAFRSAEPCAVAANNGTGAALAVPLLTPAGCAGVLAIEWPPGTSERTRSAAAAATILAALLAQLTVTA